VGGAAENAHAVVFHWLRVMPGHGNEKWNLPADEKWSDFRMAVGAGFC